MIDSRMQRSTLRRRSVALPGRLVMAGVLVLFAVIGYFTTTREETNTFTGEVQRVALSPEQEIALGLQAAPQMAAQHGGLHADSALQAYIDEVGDRIVERGDADESPYQFDFHLLADERTVNAFALPGGQIFLTAAIYDLFETEEELAGVLAHEIAHVVGRHSAETVAKAKLAQGISGAAAAALYDPSNPASRGSAEAAALVAQVVTKGFTREHEIEADRLAVRLMDEAGYDPEALISVMKKLDAAGSSARPPEFFSTHPDPGRRIDQIRAAIEERASRDVSDAGNEVDAEPVALADR